MIVYCSPSGFAVPGYRIAVVVLILALKVAC